MGGERHVVFLWPARLVQVGRRRGQADDHFDEQREGGKLPQTPEERVRRGGRHVWPDDRLEWGSVGSGVRQSGIVDGIHGSSLHCDERREMKRCWAGDGPQLIVVLVRGIQTSEDKRALEFSGSDELGDEVDVFVLAGLAIQLSCE